MRETNISDRQGPGGVGVREPAGGGNGIARPFRAEWAEAAARLGRELTVRTLEVDGRQRTYELHVPPTVDLTQPVPVVLAFHGGGTSPKAFAHTTGFHAKAAHHGMAVAYLAGTGMTGPIGNFMGLWNSGPHCHPIGEEVDDVAFTRAVVEDLANVLSVDTGCVFATGFSNGGMMAYRVACEASDLVAAVAPSGCGLDVPETVPVNPVSVFHIHGTADPSGPYEGGTGFAPMFPGPFLGARESVMHFVDADGCDPVSTVRRLSPSVTVETWTGGRENTEVVLCTVDGMGHQWLGHAIRMTPEEAEAYGNPRLAQLGPSCLEVDGAELILEFFATHPRG